MARPRSKGDPFAFRLSLAAHEELVRRALKAGVSPQEFLVDQLERSLARADPLGPPRTQDPGPKVPPPVPVKPCRHWRKVRTANGMMCMQCKQII